MLHGVQAQQVGANLSAGGTVGGNLLVSGNLAVTGDASINLSAVVSNSTILDVTGTEAFLVRKNSDGGDVFTIDTTNSNVKLAATGKLYLDGGGNTYLYEVSADKVDLVVGGVTVLEVSEGGGGASDYVAIQAANKLYFDGGADTYIQESGADVLDIYVGGANMIKLTESSTDTVLITGDLTVGVDGTGHDVKLFGDTSGAYMLWDQSEDDLVLAGAAGIDLAGDIDVDGTANLDAVDIDGAVQIDATFTSGVDGQGYDTKFFGDTSGAYMMWDTSEDDLIFVGAAGIDLAGDLDVDGTTNLDNTDIDGTVNISGLTTVQTGIVPDAQDGAYLGTSSLQWSDLFLADAAVVAFGDDGEVTLTHVHNTGLLLTDDSGIGTTQLQFGDSGTYIYQKADGHLGLVGDTEIDISATTIDINGAVAMDGAITGGTNITISGELDAATLDISGNADIDGTLEADAITVNGSSLASVIQAQTVDLATSFTASANNSTDETVYPVFVDGATGTQGAETDTGLTYNPSTGVITSTQFTGAVTGNVTGNASGTAATVTSGTQASITTVANVTTVGALNAGSITSGFGAINNGSSAITTTGLISGGSLDIDDVLINGTTIGHTDDTDLMTVADGVLTVAGEVDATSLDVSGNADIDGITNLDNTDIDGTLVVDGSNISLDSTATLNIDNSNTSNGITIGTATSGVPISIGHATSETTVNDNLVVTGDLTVNGTSTTINSTTLQVDDKMIELAHSPSGSEGADSAVDGGGITLKSSDSDKTILWTNSTDQWHYNQGINITSGNLVVAGNIDLEGSIDVNGTANLDIVDIDGAVDMASTLTIGGNIDFNSGTIDLSTQTVDVTLNAAVDALNFDSNTLSIDATNNRVGIGTAAPNHTLSVTLADTTTAHFGNAEYGADEFSGISLGYRNSGDTNNIKTKIVQEGIDDGNARGHLHFLVDTVADNNSAVIADSKMMIHGTSGNVGIGTAAPSQVLEVKNDANSQTFIKLDNATSGDSAGAGMLLTSNAGTGSLWAVSSGYSTSNPYIADSINLGADSNCSGGLVLSTVGANPISLFTNSTLRMKLDDNSRISLSNNDSGGTGGEDSLSANTLFGYLAGNAIASGGVNNTLIGHESGKAITIGDHNTVVGTNALLTDDVGQKSTAIGSYALGLQNISSEGITGNTGIGYAAGYNNTTGTNNTMVGYNTGAGSGGNSNSGNTGVGKDALEAITDGGNNTAIGHRSGQAITGGDENTFLGDYSGASSTAVVGAVAIGYNCASAVMTTGANYTISIGHGALVGLTTGAQNIGIGKDALSNLTTGDYNTALGYHAMYNTSGAGAIDSDDNTAIGANSMNGNWETAKSTGNTAVGSGTMQGVMNATTNNTAIGYQAGNAITTGDSNVLVGKGAGVVLTTGSNNICIGASAGVAFDTESDNVFIGASAGGGASLAVGATIAIGASALQSLTSGASCIAIGQNALAENQSGDQNIAIGSGAMDQTGGDNAALRNIAIGTDALGGDWAGANCDDNVAIGNFALDAAMSDSFRNIAVGNYALGGVIGGDENVAIGHSAGQAITSGYYNVAIGKGSLDGLTAGSTNVAIGHSALYRATDAADGNVAIGYAAMGGNFGANDIDNHVAIGKFAMSEGVLEATAYGSVGIGYSALMDLTTGAGNVAVGYEACHENTTGSRNTAVGFQAYEDSLIGSYNTAIGYQAMNEFVASSLNNGENTALGHKAGMMNRAGISNTYIGAGAGLGVTNNSNSYNTAVGSVSMLSVTTGSSNTTVGYASGEAITTGASNTLVGVGAGDLIVGSDNNVCMGQDAGNVITDGAGNTIIGTGADASASGASNQIAIGYGAAGRADNSVSLGNGSVTRVFCADDGGAVISADGMGIGLGQTAPSAGKLEVQTTGADSVCGFFRNTESASVDPLGIHINFSACSPNNNGQWFLACSDSTAAKFYIMSDGSCQGAANSYGAISDERIKQDIRDANPQWDDIKALKVRNFRRKSEVFQYGDNAPEEIGVVAQEVEEAGMDKLISYSSPSDFELEHCGFGEEVDGEWVVKKDDAGKDMRIKSMKYSILYMKAVKALQEAMSRIEQLESKVEALEG